MTEISSFDMSDFAVIDTSSCSFFSGAVYVTKKQDIFVKYLEFISLHAHTILNCGAGSKRFNKWLEPHAHLFENSQYFAFDAAVNPNLDWCGDIENIALRNESVDAIICWSVLEHVFEPQRCVEEMYRVLKPGGLGLFHVPMWHPLHGNFKAVDCYRFTFYGLLYCFRQFRQIFIQPQGDYSDVLARMVCGYSKSRPSVQLQKLIRPAIAGAIWLKRRGHAMNPIHNTNGWVLLCQK